LPEGCAAAMLATQMWIMVHGAAMLRMTVMKAYGREFDEYFDRLLTAMVDNVMEKKLFFA
jgi:hypothetical protein